MAKSQDCGLKVPQLEFPSRCDANLRTNSLLLLYIGKGVNLLIFQTHGLNSITGVLPQ